jgi:PAS domain S-box-containing protein
MKPNISVFGINETEQGEKDEQFRAIMEKSPDPILLLDGEIFVDCNQAAVQMLGCAGRNVVLSLHPSAISPEFQPDGRASYEKANEMIAMAFAQGCHSFEWVHHRVNGENFPVEVSLTTMPWQGKLILHVLWRDLTERKRAEAALQNSEASYRAIFDASNDILIVHDIENGEVLDINPKGTEVLGLSRDQFRQLGIASIVSGDAPYTLEKLQEYVRRATQGDTQSFEWLCHHPTGKIFYDAYETTSGPRSWVQSKSRNQRSQLTILKA